MIRVCGYEGRELLLDVFEGDFTRALGAFWWRRGGGGGFRREGSLDAGFKTGLADVRSVSARR